VEGDLLLTTNSPPGDAYLLRVAKALLIASLISGLFAPAGVQAQNPPVTIVVDASANRHAIDPNIHGVNYATAEQLADLNFTINRYGGNRTSRYNWQLNADNTASDWCFESYPYDSDAPGELVDTNISNTRAAGAQPMVTIPMIGWAAKAGPGRTKLCSFSIARYGEQTGNDWQWRPDAGNGIRPGGAYVEGNDPNDANVTVDSDFQRGWVEHLVDRWGTAANGGVRYYILDNEHSIWHATHRDVHPVGATMDEVRDKCIDYASAIKSADPGALVVGPEEFGWAGYILSGYDLQYGEQHGWGINPDRTAHGGMDYMPWLLDQMRRHEEQTGQRLLDVFSVHYYPRSGEYGGDVSDGMQMLRNRSTRSLWDRNYTDESWIQDRVYLVPRLKEWVAAYYPGTPVAVTEYNWGAEGHINGATAQADVLGIFGREGLDMAARWTTPDASTPVYKAMKMYRNHDGNRSTFGDVSVSASAPDPDEVSAFAAERSSDGALTVIAVNKSFSARAAAIQVRNFVGAGSAQVYQLTSANRIDRLADATAAGGQVNATLPAQSITLFVLPAEGQEAPAVRVTSPNGGERFRAGTTVTISWTAEGNVASQDILLSSDGGATYATTIAAGLAGTARGFSWAIPATLQGRRFRVMVVARSASGQSGSDASDANFRIRRRT
jgi:hypothetical protein